MARRVYIIKSKREEIIEKHQAKGEMSDAMTAIMNSEIKTARVKAVKAALQDAEINGAGEIAWGIPPALANLVTEDMLPFTYQEPEPVVVPEKLTKKGLLSELKALGNKIATLE